MQDKIVRADMQVEEFEDIELGSGYIDSRGFIQVITAVHSGGDSRFKYVSHTGQAFSKTGKSDHAAESFNLVKKVKL